MTADLLASLRPRQWVKNLFVFAPLLFSRNLFNPSPLLLTLAGFAALCACSSAVYLLNDLLDRENDRQHPVKRHRPIASGRVGARAACVAMALLGLAGLAAGAALHPHFGLLLAVYLTVNVAYSFHLKHVVIIDVMAIASGFVIRVVSGAVIIGVAASHWLVMCTILLSLFLGFAKRRHELTILEGAAEGHRRVLEHYSPYFLDQMILIVTASTVMSYALYTVSPEVIARFGTDRLIYTVPFVLYGIFRYLYLVLQRQEGGSPTAVLLTDRPLIATLVLWVGAVVAMIYL